MSSEKFFISNDDFRNDAIKLAYKIEQSGFYPDVIYAVLRGGSYLANIVSEYFKVLGNKQGRKRPVYYAAVVARSGHNENDGALQSVVIDGWTYDPRYLRVGDKVLILDDIFDTGKTLHSLTKEIYARGLPKEDVKIAVPYYRLSAKKDDSINDLKPDFYSLQHDTKKWIHYLSHELEGLTSEDIKKHFSNDKELQEALNNLLP